MKSKNDNPKNLKNKYVPTVEFYSQVIDSLQDYSIFTLDNELKINSWSSGSENIFGYPAEEIMGAPFEIIFTAEDIKNKIPETEIKKAFKEGRATDNRWHIAKNKSLFYAHGLVFPLIGLHGEQLGYVKILQDLTERKKSEDAVKKHIQELEELNTHKENVLAILSHDLRGPLAAIIGSAEFLKENFNNLKPETVQKMLNILYKSSKDELDMLDYLVQWARIKYAADVFLPTKIILTEYIDKVIQNLNETASLKDINLHHKISKEITVFADGKMLISIIQNIVNNAIKHTNNGGKVTISAKSTGEKVIVKIKDTGIGMSKKIIETLFTPQIKALSQNRDNNKGAGIGLLLVKGFLEKNSGEIWAESTEGVGSTFYLTLPVEKPLGKIDISNEAMFDESA